MKAFKARDEARTYFTDDSENYFNSVVRRQGLDNSSLSKLNLSELEEKKELAESLLKNKQFISKHSKNYMNTADFILLDQHDTLGGFHFSISNKLYKVIYIIQEKIDNLIGIGSVQIIGDLVDKLPETETKEQIQTEIKQIQIKTDEVKKHSFVEKKNYDEVIEFERHKADMFNKKTETWLRILGKESVASILGAILLIILSISILVIMYIGREPIKIVETAFLLILGYFFGQSHSKSKD